MERPSMDLRMSVLPTAKYTFIPDRESIASSQNLQQPCQGGGMEVISHFYTVMAPYNQGEAGGTIVVANSASQKWYRHKCDFTGSLPSQFGPPPTHGAFAQTMLAAILLLGQSACAPVSQMTAPKIFLALSLWNNCFHAVPPSNRDGGQFAIVTFL